MLKNLDSEEFLELYGKVEAVVKNCLLRWSGHLFEVPSTHLFDQCFSFKHISLFYDTLNISGHWRRFSTVSVKSPTNFAQRLYIRVEVLLRAANLRHGTHGFTSLLKEFILRIFKLWKNPSTPAGLEPANLGSSGEHDNHGTTGVDVSRCKCMCLLVRSLINSYVTNWYFMFEKWTFQQIAIENFRV